MQIPIVADTTKVCQEQQSRMQQGQPCWQEQDQLWRQEPEQDR